MINNKLWYFNSSINRLFYKYICIIRKGAYLYFRYSTNMPINLQVTEASLPLLEKVSKDRLQNIEDEIKPLLQKVAELTREKKELGELLVQISANKPSHALFGDYNPKATILAKISYILRKYPEPQTSRQISNALLSIDEELAKDPKALYKNVSTILSINKGEGKTFRRIEEEGKDYLFTMY